MPSAFNCSTFRFVAECCHAFIAGRPTGLSVASSKVVAEVVGDPRRHPRDQIGSGRTDKHRSDARDNWMCPISASSLRSHSDV